MGRKNSKSRKNRHQRDLRKEIYSVLKSQSTKPLNYKQVASALGVKDSQLRRLINEILLEESRKGKLVAVERGKYKLKRQPREQLEGIIQITKTGRGFVIVDGFEEDVSIHRYDTKNAFWGDRVLIQFNPHGRKLKGKVVEVIERARDVYVGTIDADGDHVFATPSDSRIHIDFFIPHSELNGAKHNQKVILELIDWDDNRDNPRASVIKVLGNAGDNDAEMHAILAEFGLPNEFPEEVQVMADRIPQKMTEQEIAKRKDLRDVLTFTIDPEDAKDFDDALSYQILENGNIEVGIHIADVSHFMQPGTILDQEAIARATSVYLVDRTIPMLPEVLSNNLCSLRPNEDKYCFSAMFELDKDAMIQKEWFGRTVIHSNRRFTYEEAQERIETKEGDLSAEINHLNTLAHKMRKRRFAKGGIDFRTEEVRFKLDEDGKPTGVYIKHMKEANQLIEDFMLLANTRVATFIASKEKTYVYRIHDKPDPMKLVTLREFVSKFGYQMPMPTAENADKLLRALMKQIQDSPEYDLIQMMAIRSMAKAEYSTNNIGHFGLAFAHYSHFTSPIRRYPDVLAHRLLQHYLDGGKSANADELESQCKHCSIREKLAQDAEWASIKYKQVEFMASRIGENFRGVISGLTGWGMYVELTETKCEGMVSLKNIEYDRYEFDEERYVIYGARYGQEYHLGDEVEVTVVGADMIKRTLDFELIQPE